MKYWLITPLYQGEETIDRYIQIFMILELPTVLQEASFDLLKLNDITVYVVFLSDDHEALIFRNPKIPTDTFFFEFEEIHIEPNDNPNAKSVVFSLPGVTDRSYAVQFIRPNQAKRFREYKVIKWVPN